MFIVTQNVAALACSLFGICVYTAEIKGTYSLKLCLGSHIVTLWSIIVCICSRQHVLHSECIIMNDSVAFTHVNFIYCPYFIVYMQFLGHPSLVVPEESHNIYTNYMYLCGGKPGEVLGIKMTLKPVGMFMSIYNLEPPVYT